MNAEVIEIATIAIQRYAETHPRPPHVTQKQAATMLHVSEATISRMVKTNRIKLNPLGQIPISEIDRVVSAA